MTFDFSYLSIMCLSTFTPLKQVDADITYRHQAMVPSPAQTPDIQVLHVDSPATQDIT